MATCDAGSWLRYTPDSARPVRLAFLPTSTMAFDPEHSDTPRILRPGVRIAAVVSRFHAELTGAMLESARRELERAGMQTTDFEVVWVPGSFELPLVARRLARRAEIEAVLCLGLVLRGETTHDQYVASAAMQGIVQASFETDKPILFGVLTCQTLDQARERALPPEAGGRLDKGREVARAALETLAALRQAESAPTLSQPS